MIAAGEIGLCWRAVVPMHRFAFSRHVHTRHGTPDETWEAVHIHTLRGLMRCVCDITPFFGEAFHFFVAKLRISRLDLKGSSSTTIVYCSLARPLIRNRLQFSEYLLLVHHVSSQIASDEDLLWLVACYENASCREPPVRVLLGVRSMGSMGRNVLYPERGATRGATSATAVVVGTPNPVGADTSPAKKEKHVVSYE